MKKGLLIVLAGPTAVGKTSTAIQIAQHFETEIVSADSRQFYKEMCIGTAVPTHLELQRIKHHFIQHISINTPYDVASYTDDALNLLDMLFQKYPVVVMTGGSGLFINAVCKGLDRLPTVPEHIRAEVQQLSATRGLQALQQKVQQCDPAFYATVDIKNPRRLQRALETYLATGRPISAFRKGETAARLFHCAMIGLRRERSELIERIDARVEAMMADGLEAEALGLLPFRHLNALNTVGYKELFDYFDKKISLPEAIEKIKISTRQYAKRQMTWFGKDSSFTWFHPDELARIIDHLTIIRSEIT